MHIGVKVTSIVPLPTTPRPSESLRNQPQRSPTVVRKNKEWSQNVIDLLLGRRSLQEVRASAGKPEEKCKAEFYAGELHLQRGARTDAAAALRAAADICPKDFIEHQGAVAALKRLNP